jgi:hypothetical protein
MPQGLLWALSERFLYDFDETGFECGVLEFLCIFHLPDICIGFASSWMFRSNPNVC